jgi:hypothetical protein
VPAIVLMGSIVLLVGSILFLALLNHERILSRRHKQWVALPWNSAWPALPGPLGDLREDVARALFTFAGRKPEVLTLIPCYCGCKSQGHRSNHDCFVERRSVEGVVTKWNRHALSCPLAADIAGDVMLWHRQGKSLQVIRQEIDREFARGPATETPPPK